MKVNLMIIGAMKCGTTSLANIFSHHPQISFSKPKETGFFRDENWSDNVSGYHNLFNEKSDLIKYYAEGDTNYTKHATSGFNIWDRIYDYNKNVKFIYLVRDPIDRIVSEYTHLIQKGYQEGAFEDLIFSQSNYIDNSKYYTQIIPYIKKFGKEQVMILDFDDFIKNKERILNEIADFLDIEKFVVSKEVHVNKSAGNLRFHYKTEKFFNYLKPITRLIPSFIKTKIKTLLIPSKRQLTEKPKLSTDQKEKLFSLLEEDIKKFEELAGKQFDKWKVL